MTTPERVEAERCPPVEPDSGQQAERWTIFRQTYGKGRVEAIDGPDTRRIEVVPASALDSAQREAANWKAKAQMFRDYADSADRGEVQAVARLETTTSRLRVLEEACEKAVVRWEKLGERRGARLPSKVVAAAYRSCAKDLRSALEGET